MILNYRPAVFFDRDGVLNEDSGYVYKKEDFQWIDGAVQAVKFCNDNGYYTFVVTNQGGIARGYYKEEDVRSLHRWMNEELSKFGARIDEFFYCPHYEAGIVKKYSVPCECRKPGTKMLEQAFDKYPINKLQSIMIGDKISDIKCAENAGISAILFKETNLYNVLHSYLIMKEKV